MSQIRKAIIIGGGPAGLSTALRLQQTTNIQCTVYELRPEPTTLGGAVGILSNGIRLLDRLGVYDSLRARGSSRSNLVIHSKQGSILGHQEDTVSYGRAKTGYGYMRIKRAELVDVLLEATHKAKIPVHFNKRITAIDDNEKGVTATFSDGTTDKGDILIGCDGIHSQVRSLHVDPEQGPEYSGFSGLFGIIPMTKLPPLANQFSGFNVMLTEEGMFAAFPCSASGDELYWGVSREVPLPASGDTKDGWELHRKEEIEGFKSTLHEFLHGAQGDFATTLGQLIDATDVMKFYPVYTLPPGRTWHKGRCIVLGDAAHAMKPHAGQGVSMALEDGFLLARLLKDPARPLYDVFEKYEEIRRPRVDELFALATKNGNVRKKTGPWGLWVKEKFISVAIGVPAALGFDKFGYGQKHLVYDIEEVSI